LVVRINDAMICTQVMEFLQKLVTWRDAGRLCKVSLFALYSVLTLENVIIFLLSYAQGKNKIHIWPLNFGRSTNRTLTGGAAGGL
jgi:hypothetical protein